MCSLCKLLLDDFLLDYLSGVCIPYVSLGEISLNDINIILYGVNCKETTGEMEYNPLSINCAEFLKQLKEGREPVPGELSVAGVIACMARGKLLPWI